VVRAIALWLAAALGAQAADIPRTLVSEDEAEPIHSAIVRKEAWTQDAVRRLRAEADRRMREGPWTITSDRPKGVDVDPHEYYSEALVWWPDPEHPDGPYIRREGRTNPDRFTANRNALNAMCDSVLILGEAAYFLDDAAYGQRAARVIHTWFVNPKTHMNPSLDYADAVRGEKAGRATGIIEGRVFIRAVQGMEFLAQTRAWDLRDQTAVHKWFEEYLHWLIQSKNGMDERRNGSNHASWWIAQTAALATFVEDQPSQQLAFKTYRELNFPRRIRPGAAPPNEEERWRSLDSSAVNLEAFSTTCRIAQVQGVDLWSVSGRGGATIGKLIDSLGPYLRDPRNWNREQAAELQNDSPYFLAFAGMGLKNPEYVELFQKLERPEGPWSSLLDLLVARWEAAGHQTRH
jgi:hypothetical protein